MAAQTRRDRSVNTETNAACLDRSVANVTAHRTMPPSKYKPNCNQLFTYGPLDRDSNKVLMSSQASN